MSFEYNPTRILSKMGIAADYGDFFIIRPKENYRINSGVIVVKGDEPVIIDTGTPRDPGMKRITRNFERFKIDPDSVKYIIITHSHQDHCLNLYHLKKLCVNAKAIAPQSEVEYIQYPIQIPKAWHVALKYLGKDSFVRVAYNFFSPPIFMLFYRSFKIFSRIDYGVKKPEDFNQNYQKYADISNWLRFQTSDNEFHIIPTPGHSAGHISILDKNKNLYLGDFLPFTPWINPLSVALDDMIQSIKNITKLSEDRVKLAVRSHGDIRRGSNMIARIKNNTVRKKSILKLHDNGPWYDERATWEVAPWDQERARFRYWLEVIEQSLERIPRYLKQRPANIYDLSATLMPNFHRYSMLMRLFFIPPSVTWTLAYCMKLEEQGIIKKIKKGKTYIWKAQ